MKIKNAEFLSATEDVSKCPPPDKPEYAMIGRSNVGKSSLINMLTGRKKLAKISSRPGKTQTINHFLINDHWYLTDLPGYGWAKVSRKMQRRWLEMMEKYFLLRRNLCLTFVLIDARLEPQEIDLSFVQWLGERNVPIAVIFTKTDKQSRSRTNRNIELFERQLAQTWSELPEIFITSAIKFAGKEEILDYIGSINQNLKNNNKTQ